MQNYDLQWRIMPEKPIHLNERQKLIDHCFSLPQENRAAHRLRQHISPDSRYSSVVLDDYTGKVLGSIRFYPLILPKKDTTLMLGPLAVNYQLRGHGIGSALIKHSLLQLQKDQWASTVVIGDLKYFSHFGFRAEICNCIQLEGEIAPLTFMGIEWKSNFLRLQQGQAYSYRS